MIRYLRLFVVLVILLAGLALLPRIGLPSERFGWQSSHQSLTSISR